jgi:hypothetical protein
LVIPGFGIISTVISASSSKNVFGQDGSLNIYLMQQTICRKLVPHIVLTTFLYIYKFNNIIKFININLKNVRMFIQGMLIFHTNNPLITKAPSFFNLKFKTSLSKELSMLVGISEAIRLFSTYSIKNKNSNHEKKFNE